MNFILVIMENISEEKEKIGEDNDDDNIGRDNYFMIDRKNYSDSDSNEEDSNKTIPNITDYLNNNNDEIKEFVENPRINPNNNIINNRIEDNINTKDISISHNRNLDIVNNNDDKALVNNTYKNIINKGNKDIEDLFQIGKKNNNISLNDQRNTKEIRSNNSKEEGEIVERLSSDEEDIKEVPNDQFANYFQNRNESGRKINIIYSNVPSNNNMNEIIKKNKKKNYQEDDKIFESFFKEKEVKINKNIEMPKKNNNNNINFNKNKNNKNLKLKEFVPIQKEDFKTNTYFEKLLINRVEHQVLTNIYNTYENKEKFDQTYYHINAIKNIIIHQGVEEAIKYLDNIEPLDLRTKVAIESTYFFKEVVREEVENAKAHNGELILIKQPDYFYNQNMKLSGKLNNNNTFRRKGNSIMRFRQTHFNMNKYGRNYFNGTANNGEYSIYNNRFNSNKFGFRGNIMPNKRINDSDMNDE